MRIPRGGGAGKIVAIVVAVALIGGGAAFFLTRDSGGGGSTASFCEKVKQAQLDEEVDVFDPAKVDAQLATVEDLAKSAPSEIKADMDVVVEASRKFRDAVKANKLEELQVDEQRFATATQNIEKFAKDKCGVDLNSGSSDLSSDFDSDSFQSDLDSLCSEFGSDFCS